MADSLEAGALSRSIIRFQDNAVSPRCLRAWVYVCVCVCVCVYVYRFNEEARAEKLMPHRSPESPLLRNGARIVRPSRSLLVTERSSERMLPRAQNQIHSLHPSDSGSVIATTIATMRRRASNRMRVNANPPARPLRKLRLRGYACGKTIYDRAHT